MAQNRLPHGCGFHKPGQQTAPELSRPQPQGTIPPEDALFDPARGAIRQTPAHYDTLPRAYARKEGA